MTFGEEFRDARLKADKGLKEAAELIGRGITTVTRIEANKPVSERTMIKAAQAKAVLKQMVKTDKEYLKLGNI